MATLTVGYLASGSAAASPNYSTIASALAAASAGDTIEVYYADAYRNLSHFANYLTVSKAVTIVGKVGNQQLVIGGASNYLALDIQASATVENFTITAANYGVMSQGGSGITVVVSRCVCRGEYAAYFGNSGCTASINNCILLGGVSGVLCSAGTVNCNFCAAGSTSSRAFQQNGGTLTCKNCVGLYCNTATTSFYGTIGGNNNASYDGSGPSTGRVNIATNDPKFWKDESTSYAGLDIRITPSSSLAGAGASVSGVTVDMFGRTRASTPSIGPFEAWATPTAPAAGDILSTASCILVDGTTRTGTFDETARNTDPGVANVVDGTTYKIQNVSKEGTLVGEAHTADEVIDTAGGNYVTTAASIVKNGESFGVGETGTYLPSALLPSEATKLDEIHKILGLDASSPMTVTPSARTAGDISLTLTGDGLTTTTVSRTA